jgi:hypothetical protein
VGEAHRGQHQRIAGWLDGRDVLALSQHDGADADAARILQRVPKQRIRLPGFLIADESRTPGGYEPFPNRDWSQRATNNIS